MTKELQDHVWSILPKEFKEEVKKEYRKGYVCETLTMLITLFGHHNLTSDAEEEEMLTVSRKRVQDEFNSVKIIASEKMCSKVLAGAADMYLKTLERLFGSKCLPDNVESSEPNVESSEPNVDSLPQNPTENCDNKSHISADCNKQAEPKFKVGDIVRFKYCCTPHRIDGFKMLDGVMLYQVGEVWAEESDLEPYTEPKEDLIASNSGELKSQEADKHSDNILKDSFAKERRLNIAAMMMQGLLANPNNNANLSETVVDALNCADALIAEVEKGNSDGED